MKSVGHWYVRKERRGLVYLVIDNRHAVEKLEQLEQYKGQGNLELLENEQPLDFADVFPRSTASRKRGQSPERKFVVAFVNPSSRSDDDFHARQEPEIEFFQASPSTPHGDRFLLPSPSRENRSAPHSSTDSDVESIGRSAPSQFTPKSKTERRAAKESTTSRLILDIIPHEIADEALKPAQNMSTLTLLEAKAEETIDMLMRHWTYVDPEYFSEDGRSSIASSEPSLSSFQNRDHPHADKGKSPDLAERPCRNENSIREGSNSVDKDGLVEELFASQWVTREESDEASSSLPAGRIKPAQERPSPPSPTVQPTQGNRDARARRPSQERSSRVTQSLKEPSTPAPPYSSGQPIQCSSCSAASDAEFQEHAEKRPWMPIGGGIVDEETDKGTNASIDSAVKLFETRLLEVMNGYYSGPNIKPDAQSHQANQQKEDSQQPTAHEQDAEPVILKDCLGRKFLFPIQKCKSWQVSPPTELLP